MALASWKPRKSFDEAMAKAEQLKNAARTKEQRNSGLFTQAQQNLRKELRLDDRENPAEAEPACQYCNGVQLSPTRIKPSRSMTKARIRRR
ncbi:MAG: hypothetical protein WA090_00805 [Candidatus Nanopelagicaceae bacterium]